MKTLINVILILLLAPLTIIGGVIFLDDRKYYFISILLIVYSMIPIFVNFESRRPKARELVVISVLTAIAVAGRVAFFMTPQFKPVIAIIVIAGFCFGGETGFLVGSMTAFISNFFFGMGPFTPWQMFSMGMIGYIAGLLQKKGILKSNRTSLCIFGGLSTFFIYGAIMDLSTVLAWAGKISWNLIAITYISGFPFNLIHSVSTVIFLFLLSKPMIAKLERIKIKYGFSYFR